jgi:hypothetical protein
MVESVSVVCRVYSPEGSLIAEFDPRQADFFRLIRRHLSDGHVAERSELELCPCGKHVLARCFRVSLEGQSKGVVPLEYDRLYNIKLADESAFLLCLSQKEAKG